VDASAVLFSVFATSALTKSGVALDVAAGGFVVLELVAHMNAPCRTP
jgi:hypothetical protein